MTPLQSASGTSPIVAVEPAPKLIGRGSNNAQKFCYVWRDGHVLIKGHKVFIDKPDWDKINFWIWHIIPQSANRLKFRVRGYPPGFSHKRVYMHTAVLGAPLVGLEIDHIDQNPLNNTRNNLRMVDRYANQANRGKNKNNTAGYKGVTRERKKFIAQIDYRGMHIRIGSYNTAKEASDAYIEKRKELCLDI